MRASKKDTPVKNAEVPTLEYTHRPLGEDGFAFAGFYTPEKEVRLAFRGREVLYVTGQIVIEATCHEGTCAIGTHGYAIVAGYVVRWQYRRNEEGQPVSEIEPVVDRETKMEIGQIIQKRESLTRIEFR